MTAADVLHRYWFDGGLFYESRWGMWPDGLGWKVWQSHDLWRWTEAA